MGGNCPTHDVHTQLMGAVFLVNALMCISCNQFSHDFLYSPKIMGYDINEDMIKSYHSPILNFKLDDMDLSYLTR